MEQSKRASLSVARSILNHKLIGKKLESYLKVCVRLLYYYPVTTKISSNVVFRFCCAWCWWHNFSVLLSLMTG